jgi:UDP-3-O-[3-hydroxymyristoyl] N-acetylglucosamine deacetylase
MLLQRTLRRPVHAIGIGVHTARPARLTIRPAPSGTGIVFGRADSAPQSPIPASALNFPDTTLSTTIGRDDVQVATVEHLMSAFWGLGVDNAWVEIHGEEVPILDGSAAPFVDLMQIVGVVELDQPREFIRIRREITVTRDDARASLSPHPGFRAAYTFVADHPIYNRYPKHVAMDFAEVCYIDQVARARTFGLARELARAQANGKCLGSSLDNAIGVGEEGVLNSEGLRYADEFVKHKVLDAIGDLYLLGRPLLGAFDGYKSGHGLNHALARALLAEPDSWELVTFSRTPKRSIAFAAAEHGRAAVSQA